MRGMHVATRSACRAGPTARCVGPRRSAAAALLSRAVALWPERIGWRFKRVGPSGDDAHECLAARRGRCARALQGVCTNAEQRQREEVAFCEFY